MPGPNVLGANYRFWRKADMGQWLEAEDVGSFSVRIIGDPEVAGSQPDLARPHFNSKIYVRSAPAVSPPWSTVPRGTNLIRGF